MPCDCSECEAHATRVHKAGVDFNNDSEKEQVREVFENAISCLSKDDKDLHAVQHILPLLMNGIGVHHSGLLPILKELVELLFQEQLIKVSSSSFWKQKACCKGLLHLFLVGTLNLRKSIYASVDITLFDCARSLHFFLIGILLFEKSNRFAAPVSFVTSMGHAYQALGSA